MEQIHLKNFYNSLRDEPLTPDSPLYVPYLEGENDLIAELKTQIAWSEAASVNLFTGQRGSGKSTELRRLKKLLEEEGCVVFLADMSEFIHLTKPIEISDFLISIMAALGERVTERFGKDILAKGYWQRLTTFLQTEVRLDEMQLKGGPVEIKASLKDDPSFKAVLQEKLRGHVARLVRQTQEFVTEVVAFVRRETKDPDKKVVYLIDSMEQIRGVGTEASEVYMSVENLFSGHAGTLAFPLMHIVYTIPPFLIPLAPNIGARLGGGSVYSLPSVHIYNYLTRDVDEQGIAIMENIVDRRCNSWREVFAPRQLRRMALASGGDLRDFFRLMKQCLVKASTGRTQLPVGDEVIADAENQLRREMLPLAGEDREWLCRIVKSKSAELQSKDDLPTLARFLETKLVLNYRNGEDWYDVHPLLQSYVEAVEKP